MSFASTVQDLWQRFCPCYHNHPVYYPVVLTEEPGPEE